MQLTNYVDQATHDDSPFATDRVRNITGDEGTKEGTSGKNGNDERRVGAGESCGGGTLDQANECWGANNTVDVSRVVAKEDTSERGEGAEQVSFPGHWSFDALDIARGSEPNGTARHTCGCSCSMFSVYVVVSVLSTHSVRRDRPEERW